jgi:hypothetical protein
MRSCSLQPRVMTSLRHFSSSPAGWQHRAASCRPVHSRARHGAVRTYASSSSTSDKIQSTLADLDAILGARGLDPRVALSTTSAPLPLLPAFGRQATQATPFQPLRPGAPRPWAAGIDEQKKKEEEEAARQKQQAEEQRTQVSVSPDVLKTLAEAEAKRAQANGGQPNKTIQQQFVSGAGRGVGCARGGPLRGCCWPTLLRSHPGGLVWRRVLFPMAHSTSSLIG